MKTCLLRAVWAAAVFLIASGDIVQAVEPLVAFSTTTESGTKRMLLPVGTRRTSFLEQMGPPDAWLSRDVCAYWDRRTNQPELTRGYDTLLVEFDQGRVSRLRIVAGAPVREFLARREKSSSGSRFATVAPAAESGSR
jgi:hypothetical protein